MRKQTTAAGAVLLLTMAFAAWAALEIEPTAAPGAEPEPTAGAAAETRAPTGQGRLTWQDGDRLTLRMATLEPETGLLTGQREGIRETLSIATTDLDRFEAAGAFVTAEGQFPWAVHLANGDVLRGSVSSLTDTELRIETWYDGPVVIARSAVRLLEHCAADAVLYEGPLEGESGWVVTSGQPLFARDRIVMSHQAMVSRVLPRRPDKMRFDFTAVWMWHGHLRILFPADVPEQRHHMQYGYSLTLQGNNRIDLHRQTPQRGSRRIGQATMSGVQADQRQQHVAQITVFADFEARRFQVHVNGQPTGDWTDSESYEPTGEAIVFAATQSHPLELRSIRVSEWDGHLPSEALHPDPEKESVAVRLRNGDALTGELASISEGSASVTTSFGALTIPLDRMAHIAFPVPAAESATEDGAVQLVLADRSTLTLTGLRLADGTFQGQTGYAGSLRIPLPGVRSMRWHLGRNRSTDSTPDSSSASNPGPGMAIGMFDGNF